MIPFLQMKPEQIDSLDKHFKSQMETMVQTIQTTPADELLADPEVNTVILTVPNYLHKDMCIKAAKAGKNVLTLRSRSTAPFKTKGVAMNPVDHPHGGGSHAHVGGPNCQKRTASPGQKVGFLPPKKKVKK